MRKKDNRQEVVITDIEGIVPKEHLLRKIERVMDYEWIYERLCPYYCADNGRPGTDPVVLIKMVLIQHLFGIPSLRQTYREIQVNVAYRWFLGYNLLEEIPHFATVSYAFCNRFPGELSEEIFAHILNKALNNGMVEPSMIFIDGTHIKASANKKKFQKEHVARTAKVYEQQLREEVAAEREKPGKKNDEVGPNGGGTVSKTVSTHTHVTGAGKTASLLGTSLTICFKIALYVRRASSSAIPPPAKMEDGLTAATPSYANAVLANSCVAPMRKASAYLPLIFGRNTLIWLNSCAKPSAGKRCIPYAKRPLNASLRMQNKNMVCDTRSTVAWPVSLLG